MAVLDLDVQDVRELEAVGRPDVVVVGTGPAGATLVRELSATGLRLLVLESGARHRLPDSDALDEVESIGRLRNPEQWSVRNRVLGGSSHTWGGRCAPFDEIDFRARAWVPHSGWPISEDELVGYLDRSAAHLGLSVGSGFSDTRFYGLADRAVPPMPDPTQLRPFFWQFSRDPHESYPYEYVRTGRGLLTDAGPDTTIALRATVNEVHIDESGRVSSVSVGGPDGRSVLVPTNTVVLAAGGIENARLLLASTSSRPEGLGNHHDLVGRYLMDHPRGVVATFPAVVGTEALQRRLGRYNVQRTIFRGGFRLSPDLQEAEGLLNCSAWLGEDWADDDPWAALRRFAGGAPQLPRDLKAVIGNLGLLGRGARDYFLEQNGVPRKLSALHVVSMVEQQPDPNSRVTLGDRRDRFGRPLPRIDWRSHPDEARTVRRTAEVVRAQLAGLSEPVPDLAPWVHEDGPLPDDFWDVAHPTGTTRMADSPQRGVVDKNSEVHGVLGLFIAGSSVFPTAGHCNPTQMIVALAVRLADHLRGRSAPSGAVRAAAGAQPPSTNLSAVRPAVDVESTGPVLVTGATGRIGRVVVADLLAGGRQVRAVTSRAVEDVDTRDGVEWRQLDLATATAADYDELVRGCGGVVHLAAEIGKATRMRAVNVTATAQLAEAAERGGILGFCHISTVSVYGSLREREAREDGPVLSLDADRPSEYWALDYVRMYGRTKLAAERALQAVASGVSYVVLRPTVVVSEHDLVAIRDWSRVKRVLAAHRHAHHVYVRDVSAAVSWALDRAVSGAGGGPGSVEVFNVSEDSDPHPRHRDFLARAYAASGDRRFRVPPVPGAADWLHDLLRFRADPRRRPLWRMRFPSARVEAAGFRHPCGMADARGRALELLRADNTTGSGTG